MGYKTILSKIKRVFKRTLEEVKRIFKKILEEVKRSIRYELIRYELLHIDDFIRIGMNAWANKKKNKKKSVYFIGNNYNTFYTLAEGLKKRGWRAFSANHDGLASYVQNYHGDINFADHKKMIGAFFDILFNYKMVHFYNTDGQFYVGASEVLRHLLQVKYLKFFGVKVGFTPSGCLNGATQTEINMVSNGLCNKCIWQNNPQACSDVKSQQQIDWITKYCDLFANEVDLPKKLAQTSIGFSLPLSPINSEVYSLELSVPGEYHISKKPGEMIILTAFGNEKIRANNERDIKGIRFIKAAIDKLIAEGLPIRHFHANNIPAKDMKYIQIQADIVVDQLNYGTIGSAARESMMLGKPVICYVSDLMRTTNIAMKDCPVVSATEETVYDVLKELVLASGEVREEIGRKSREWMLKWFDAKVCAERFEKIYDRIMQGLPPYSGYDGY